MSRPVHRLTVAVALCLAALPVSQASGDTFKPTRFDDPVPGACTQKDCSLREAISRSNHRDGADRIVLSTGRYVIELPETLGDNNKGGDFDVVDKVTITGKGRKTIVDGQDVSRVFSLLTFPSHTLKNMVIEDGNDDNGAGILAGPATARLSKVVLRSNAASDRGGALYTASTKLKISKSTLTQNSATNGGGGIYLPTGFVGSPETRVVNSTISRNAGALGGGIYADGAERSGADDDPSVDLLNSTVAENLAAVSGGGVAAILGASANLDNTTVAYNAADSDNSGGGDGGGLFQSSAADFGINDIVLGSNVVGSSGDGPQCAGEFTGGGLIAGSTEACTIGGTFVVDAMIGSLAQNGGPTQTIALLSGSPAIDPPNPFDCPKRDQRGELRDANCDSGSFERTED